MMNGNLARGVLLLICLASWAVGFPTPYPDTLGPDRARLSTLTAQDRP